MILLIDNYDSFVFNLARYLSELGCENRVVRNDALTPAEVDALRPAALIISPGPKTPHDAGISIELVQQFAGQLPILGVCLGHQAIAAAFGAEIVRAARPVHGQAMTVIHDGSSPLLSGIPRRFPAARYHSLVVDEQTLPECLDVICRCEDGTLMGIAHRRFPVFGIQFHPESILTDGGHRLLENFLRVGKIPCRSWTASERSSAEDPDDFFRRPFEENTLPLPGSSAVPEGDPSLSRLTRGAGS